MTTTRLRSLPVQTAPEAMRVDRAAGVIHGVSAIQTGIAIGHGFLIDQKMLSQVATLGNAATDGIKSRFTHPGMCDDGLGKMTGRMKNFRVDGDKVLGDLHLGNYAAKSPEGDLRDYLLSMAEEDPKGLAMSIVFKNDPAWKLSDGSEVPALDAEGDRTAKPEKSVGDMPYARASKLQAVDAVDEAAANRDGLFAAAFAATTSADAANVFEQLDALRERMGLTVEQSQTFLARYFAARADKKLAGAKPAKEAHMGITPEKLAELCKANPTHQSAIVEMFAAGKDDVEMLAVIAETKRVDELNALKASVSELTASAAAAQTAHGQALGVKDAEIIALKASVTALTTERDALAALSKVPKDPGDQPGEKKVDEPEIVKSLSNGVFVVDSAKIRSGKQQIKAN